LLTFDTFDYFLNLFSVVVLAVPAFYLLPWEKARELLLTLVGAYLLYLIAPRLLLFYLVFWAVVALLDRIVAKAAETRLGLASLLLSIAALLGLLVAWRLAEPWFVVNFNLVFNDMLRPLSTRVYEIDLSRNIITPIGMSLAAFRAIDLLVTSNLGLQRDRSLRKTYFIGLFPPIQIVGPVAQASELKIALNRPQIDDFRAALHGTISGLFKVLVLAHLTSSAVDVLIYYENNSVWAIWLELFIYVLFFYWNFSGYSDLAIAVSALFGVRLRPNFASPLTTQNPRDFWNSWHISLSNFAQRNVFVPLGGMRRGNRQFFALFVTMMTIALWHDISIPLVIFGVYHSAGLILHRVVAERRPPRNGVSLAVIKTTVLFMFYYAISIPLISLDASEVLPFYSQLFGL
jgi:D-alanyl-lipoteichoic acid acyltransferase DltB (MBOAT superfamily)